MKAQLIPEVTKTVVETEEHVALELSVLEAQALLEIFSRTGGCPKTTGRGHIDAIGMRLYDAGIRRNPDFTFQGHACRIYFDTTKGQQ